jgi:sucrose-6-phosphate hydrolase SacC (GH32 family)
VKHFVELHADANRSRYLDDIIQQFLDQMQNMSGQPVNMTKWTQFLTFDIVGELGFGSALGCVAAGKDMYGLGHWVYMLMNVHASLGWTWRGAEATKLPIVRWLINHSLLRNVKTKLTAEPLPEFRQVWGPSSKNILNIKSLLFGSI